jgi:D5 N terminal like
MGRKILVVCSTNRCPPEEILEPLSMTVAEICAGDDVDDLGEEEAPAPASTPEPGTEAAKASTKWYQDGQADLANARHLVTLFGDRLRYVVPWKKWLCWDGTRWAVDETGQAWRYATRVADTLPKQGAKGGPVRAQTAPGLSAMLQLAGTEPAIAVAPSALDADPTCSTSGTGHSTCGPTSYGRTTRPTC